MRNSLAIRSRAARPRLEIATAIDQIDPARWDAVAGDHLTMRHRWLRVIERCDPHLRPCYVLLHDDRGPLAALAANLDDHFVRGGLREWLLQRAIVVFRPPSSKLDAGLVLRPGASIGDVLALLDRVWLALAWRTRRPLIGVNNCGAAEIQAWTRAGFTAIRQPGVALLELRWRTHDAYLAALSRSERAELRRLRRRADERGVQFRHGALRPGDERLWPLLEQVFVQHGAEPGDVIFSADLFDVLAREYGRDSVLIEALVGDRLAGYIVAIGDGDTLLWFQTGLEYPISRPAGLYLLLLDELVRCGIAHGYRRIFGGLFNREIKRRRGFQIDERGLCVRAGSSVANAALNRLLPLARRLAGSRALPPPT